MGTLTGLDTVITYLTAVLAAGTIVLALAGLVALMPALAAHRRTRLARHESLVTYWRHPAAPVH